jgi:hypothetical protein
MNSSLSEDQALAEIPEEEKKEEVAEPGFKR